MIHENVSRRLPAELFALLFPALILGLTRYSYRAEELLVCWLLFCSFFALLVLVFLGVVLAFHAGQHLVRWVRAAKTVIRELVVSLAQPPQQVRATPRILVSGTLETLAGPCPQVNVLDSHSSLLIKVPPSIKESVYN
jgi:hypothetical protein